MIRDGLFIAFVGAALAAVATIHGQIPFVALGGALLLAVGWLIAGVGAARAGFAFGWHQRKRREK